MACNAIDLEEKKNIKKWRGYSMPLRRVDAKVAESMYSRTPPVSSAITNINNNHCDTTTYIYARTFKGRKHNTFAHILANVTNFQIAARLIK